MRKKAALAVAMMSISLFVTLSLRNAWGELKVEDEAPLLGLIVRTIPLDIKESLSLRASEPQASARRPVEQKGMMGHKEMMENMMGMTNQMSGMMGKMPDMMKDMPGAQGLDGDDVWNHERDVTAYDGYVLMLGKGMVSEK